MFNAKLNKTIVIALIIILIADVLCFGDNGNEPNYIDLFEQGMNHISKFRNPYGGLEIRVPPGGQKEILNFEPIPTELKSSEAISFLTNVLKNGPNWQTNHHLARCYAAICLGMTGDSRALEPLIEATDMINEEQRQHRVSGYAATALGLLGDVNAVEPLISVMRSKKPITSDRAILALTRLGDLRAVGPILEALEEKNQQWKDRKGQFREMFSEPIEPNDFETKKAFFDAKSKVYESRRSIYEVNNSLSKLTRVDIGSDEPNEIPEFWSQWWKGGPQFTRGRFESKRNEWKAMKKETSLEKSNAKRKLSEIKDLGIPAIPFMIEKVEEGETDFIPLISRLTNKELAEDATIDECLDWWDANKQRWLIPFLEPNDIPLDPNN